MSIYRNVPVSVNIIGLLIVVDLPKMNLEHFCHPLFFLIRKSVKHSLVTASEMFRGLRIVVQKKQPILGCPLR